MPRWPHVAAWVACVGLGVAASLATTLLHPRWWGLLLGVSAAIATLVALPSVAFRLGFVLGWVTLLTLAMLPRPEGDFAVAATPVGYALLASAPALLVVALALRRARPARAADAPEGSPHSH